MPEPTTPTSSGDVSPPLQARSRKTYARILDAAERLLATQDLEGLRLEDLLAEARVSVGSFYARFRGKEAIVDALVERYREDVDTFTRQPTEIDAENLEQACRLVVSARVRRFRRRKGMLRLLTSRQRTRSRATPELRALSEEINVWMVSCFMRYRDEIGHDDPERAIRTGSYFVGAICRDRVLFTEAPHSSTVALSLARLERELSDMLWSYLRGGG